MGTGCGGALRSISRQRGAGPALAAGLTLAGLLGGCAETEPMGSEDDAGALPCQSSPDCPAGFLCVSGTCIGERTDSDGDGIAADSDCDDSDPAIGTSFERACTAECGEGTQRCESGRVQPCTCDGSRDGGPDGSRDGGQDGGSQAARDGGPDGSATSVACTGEETAPFSLSTAQMRTSFTCPDDTWCARMGVFIPASSSPDLYPNTEGYGGRTGFPATGVNQRGLSPDPGVRSVVIQGGSQVGWYYGSDIEHDVWDDQTANLATAYRFSTPRRVFPASGNGYARFQFSYLVAWTNHDPAHPGCRLAGWVTFRDDGDPTLDPAFRPVIWIGVKPFDGTNPDTTVAIPDHATRTPAFIFRQAITVNQTDPMQPNYYQAYLPRNDQHYGPFLQFDPAVPSDREFLSEADPGTWRTIAFRVYKANMQSAIDMARDMCSSAAPHPRCTNDATGNTLHTDAWSADPADWALVNVVLNPECPRRENASGNLLLNEFGYTARDLAGGCVN